MTNFSWPPISVTTSAPVGGATEAKQDAQIVQETAVNTKLTAQAVLLGAVNEAAPASDTASSGLNGRLQRIAQNITSLIALFPSSIGQKVRAASLSVSWATEQEAQIGIVTETAPASDTASSGLNGRLQRIAQRITSLIALVPASLGQKASASSFAVTLSSEQEAEIGALTETAPGTDTASSGLNGRLQRVAQNLTSHNALFGAVTETAPASDTASSGLNGRLQRIAQRLTSLIALLPASLGQKTMAGSLAVAIASDQPTLAVNDSTSVAGTISSAQVAVGTTRVRATAAGTAPSASRKRLCIKPNVANTGRIWIGDSTVTIATGMEIVGPDRIDWEYDAADYYMISDTAAQVVEILEKV